MSNRDTSERSLKTSKVYTSTLYCDGRVREYLNSFKGSRPILELYPNIDVDDLDYKYLERCLENLIDALDEDIGKPSDQWKIRGYRLWNAMVHCERAMKMLRADGWNGPLEEESFRVNMEEASDYILDLAYGSVLGTHEAERRGFPSVRDYYRCVIRDS